MGFQVGFWGELFSLISAQSSVLRSLYGQLPRSPILARNRAGSRFVQKYFLTERSYPWALVQLLNQCLPLVVDPSQNHNRWYRVTVL